MHTQYQEAATDQIWIYDPGREVILQLCKYARFARRGRAAPGLGWWPGVPWGWAGRGGAAGAFFGCIISVTGGKDAARRRVTLP